MFRNIFFNIILIAVVVFLSLKLYNSLTKPLSFPLESPQKQTSPQQDKKGDGNITNKNKEEMPGYQVPDYQVIVQKDIFKQIRAERRLEAPPPPPPPPLPAPRLIGITIIGDKARAFLEDLVTRTIKAYGINDSIADFIIKEIYSDKVALTRGNETVEVSIVKVKTTDERGIPLSSSPPFPPSASFKRPTFKRPTFERPTFEKPRAVTPTEPVKISPPAPLPAGAYPRPPLPLPDGIRE